VSGYQVLGHQASAISTLCRGQASGRVQTSACVNHGQMLHCVSKWRDLTTCYPKPSFIPMASLLTA